jgi:acyl-CoA synthetase (NDP forming)
MPKNDVGGLHSAKEVVDAAARVADLAHARGARFDGVLLQREVSGVSEALVGITTDPTSARSSSTAGGVLIEPLRDVAFRLMPVSRLDAEEMIARVRSAKLQLLDGSRGATPGECAALAELIERVSALVDAVPEIRELELNPVKVLEPGRGVVIDVRVRIGKL